MKNILKHNVELQNMKSLSLMNDFIKRIFFSYMSIYKVLILTIDDLMKIQNESTFQLVDNILIEQFNKLIMYFYDNISGILLQVVQGHNCNDTLIIKPVNLDRNIYSHKLEIIYFMSNDSYVTKILGEVTNINIVKLNNQISIYRGSELYQLNLIELNSIISTEDFRNYIQNYIDLIKNISGLLYNDMKYTKVLINSLVDILSDTLKISSDNIEKWKKLFMHIKSNNSFMKKALKTL